LQRNPEFALCGTSFYSGIKDGPLNKIKKMPNDFNQIKRRYLIESQVHGPTMMCRIKIIKHVGGLYRSAELFRNMEDVELITRIIEKYKITNLNEPLYYYRNLPDSLSKSGYSYLKFEGMKLIQFLSTERKQKGKDSLSTGGSEALNALLQKLEAPYIEDKSLLHRKAAANLMYFNFFTEAIKQSFLAIYMQPLIFDNYRTAQYCLRTYLSTHIKTGYDKFKAYFVF